MIIRKLILSLVATGFASSFIPAFAGPLTSAEVTKIINQVSVIDPQAGGHRAAVREVLKNDLALQTGGKSRSELLFQDNTLMRIGAETFFSFKTGTRDLTLEKGSMLLQVPKGLGGATIHTAAVTAAITGTTIMMEFLPGKLIKVLVLEGSLRLSRNGRFGDSVVLRPGKMVIMEPGAKRIPDPVDVDIQKIVETSTLVNFPGDTKPLPSMPLIQAAIDRQTQQVAQSTLVPTNLVITQGTKMILASPVQLADPAGLPNLLAASHTNGVGTNSLGETIKLVPASGAVVNNVTTPVNPAQILGGSGSVVGDVVNTGGNLPVVGGTVVSAVANVVNPVTDLVGSNNVNGVVVALTNLANPPSTLGFAAGVVGAVTDPVTSTLSSASGLVAAVDSLGGVLKPVDVVSRVTGAIDVTSTLNSVSNPVTHLASAISAVNVGSTLAPTVMSVTNSAQVLSLLSGVNPSASGAIILTPAAVIPNPGLSVLPTTAGAVATVVNKPIIAALPVVGTAPAIPVAPILSPTTLPVPTSIAPVALPPLRVLGR
ncbi:MAG: FecR domain-containing protein [Chthoniobacterales bacterium]